MLLSFVQSPKHCFSYKDSDDIINHTKRFSVVQPVFSAKQSIKATKHNNNNNNNNNKSFVSPVDLYFSES